MMRRWRGANTKTSKRESDDDTSLIIMELIFFDGDK